MSSATNTNPVFLGKVKQINERYYLYSFKLEDAKQFVNDKGYVNLIIFQGKSLEWFCKRDTFVPTKKRNEMDVQQQNNLPSMLSGVPQNDDSDLPF